MICFRDTTYCASPDCTNQCGRQMDDFTRSEAAKSFLPISFSLFCGESDDIQMEIKRILSNASTEQYSY